MWHAFLIVWGCFGGPKSSFEFRLISEVCRECHLLSKAWPLLRCYLDSDTQGPRACFTLSQYPPPGPAHSAGPAPQNQPWARHGRLGSGLFFRSFFENDFSGFWGRLGALLGGHLGLLEASHLQKKLKSWNAVSPIYIYI